MKGRYPRFNGFWTFFLKARFGTDTTHILFKKTALVTICYYLSPRDLVTVSMSIFLLVLFIHLYRGDVQSYNARLPYHEESLQQVRIGKNSRPTVKISVHFSPHNSLAFLSFTRTEAVNNES